MSEIKLTGLIGSHPLGALAAFGVLRCASQIPALGPARLSWRQEADWTAVFHAGQSCTSEQLASALVEWQRGRSERPYLTWSEDIKSDPAAFAAQLRQVRDGVHAAQRETADFFSAYGSEFVKAPSTGQVKPTAFYMVAGQQRFPKAARIASESVDSGRPLGARERPEVWQTECVRALNEALFGAWRYRDSEHSLGWDPAAEALYALSSINPSIAKPSSVRGAVWLGFEALPLFPSFAVGERLWTRGFDAGSSSLSWPIWTRPISLDSLRSLLALDELLDEKPDAEELAARGVVAVYRSDRFTDSNGRGTLRNAVPVMVRAPNASVAEELSHE